MSTCGLTVSTRRQAQGVKTNTDWRHGGQQELAARVGTVVKQVASGPDAGSHGDGSCCCVVVWIAAHASRVAVVGWSVSLYSVLMTFWGAATRSSHGLKD